MNVPFEATQPVAEELVSYEDFLLRLVKLTSSPRVKVQKLGESHGRRGLYVIVIASEEAMLELERHRRQSAAWHTPDAVHPTLFQLKKGDGVGSGGEDVRFPILITGLSFGQEASHVEGHLALSERLAWGEDDEVSAILGRLIVLVMPMLNPDGRAISIDEWSRYSLSEGSAAGNLYGFFVNRDFLHLTQPETKAVARVFKEWRPIALLDTHEDVFCLGVQFPEVCWCPHNGRAPVDEAPENIQEIIADLGEAIRVEWQRLGFKYLERNMFAHPMPGESEQGPYYLGAGNVVEAMALHGIPSVITESSRTPGAQTWEDRVRQKYSAGLALLRQVARDPADIAQKIFGNRERIVEEAQGAAEAFVIPKEQREPGAVAQLIDTLLWHDIRVYQVDGPDAAFVIPLAQAEADVARALLSVARSKVVAMPPALGIAVAPFGALSEDEQDALKQAHLEPVVEAPLPTVRVHGEAVSNHYAIPNSTDGIKLVNRLWRVGSVVRWLSQPLTLGGERFEQGTFVAEETPTGVVESLARGLAVSIYGLPGDLEIEEYTLRRPKVALYVGQGVDRPDASARADILWALDKLGFGVVPLEATDINQKILRRYDTLIVPGGDAHEIVNGWREDSLLNRSPWELPGQPSGIGREGLDALRQFVEGGGTYVGMGSGGGLLASSMYADLIDLEIMAHSLGSARVLLRVEDPDNPLMFSLDGYYDEAGKWSPGFLPAYYHAETLFGTPGGPVFRAGKGVTVLASYYRVDHAPASLQVVRESYLSESEGGAAVASQKLGQGRVIVVGVCPGFRAVWTHTWKLVSNAIFLAVAE